MLSNSYCSATKFFSTVTACVLLGSAVFAQDLNKLLKPGAELLCVSKDFKFTEGPAINKKGDIFFTDQPNDKIWKYSADGKMSLFLEKTGRANGLYFDREGNLIACADEKNQLWMITPEGKASVLLDDFKGHRFNGPNDLWIDKRGGIYFTDPYYQRSYWERKASDLDGQKVYYLPKGGKEAIIVDADLQQPNGIVGSPNGRHLFVSDIKAGKTYKYDISRNGTVSNRRLFVQQGSDGITLDNKGNLYLTGKGVTVYDKSGTKLGNIPVPAPWTANLSFAGKKRRTLFITASESVFTLEMKVKGVE